MIPLPSIKPRRVPVVCDADRTGLASFGPYLVCGACGVIDYEPKVPREPVTMFVTGPGWCEQVLLP